MAAITICSDFRAQKDKVCHCFPIYLPWSDRTDAIILVFWMLSFKPTFSLSSFTFIKRLFSSSSLTHTHTHTHTHTDDIAHSLCYTAETNTTLLSNFWTSLVAQVVKNPPAMQKTSIWSISRVDSLERGMASHSSILDGEFHGQRSLPSYSPWGHKESVMTERLIHVHTQATTLQ